MNKKNLELAILSLLQYAHELGVTVLWKDPDLCEEVWPNAWGTFDCQFMHIILYKKVTSPLRVQHVHTLAHELRHAYQYKNKMQPSYWLASLGLYPRRKSTKAEAILEKDADTWADEFMVKNYLIVPTSFDEKLI